MEWIFLAAGQAVELILSLDPDLTRIIGLSLGVSLSAVGLAGVLGVPCGVWLGLARFKGRGAVVSVLNALMGMPPVVVGLVVFMLLSRRGPLGGLELLFTPQAMVLAQTVLVWPIVTSLTLAAVHGLDPQVARQARTLGANRWQTARVVVREARFGVMAALIAGFGRAVAEVGAVLMVGGNIQGQTRVMTTTIAMETSKGDYQLALALGFVLLGVGLGVNLLFSRLQKGGG